MNSNFITKLSIQCTKRKKSKKSVCWSVISLGGQLPSDYIKQKLAEEYENFQLRKYIVKHTCSYCPNENEALYQSNLEIINMHYE